MQEQIKQFLEHVHPREGLICIMGIGGGVTKADFYSSVEEASAKTMEYSKAGIDAYYGCARFKDKRRTAVNAKFFRSFWVDIDCGKDPEKPKPYQTQADGLNALKKFCQDTGLPRPTILNSGNGLHCYWTLVDDITYNEWKPVADSLRNLCTINKFEPDLGCTGDASRILRLPGTKNYKIPTQPKEVTVIKYGEPIRYEVFKTLIGHIDVVTGHQRGEIDETTRALCGWDKNVKSMFKIILEKSAVGKGCQQILKSTLDQANVTEPQWYDILSTVAFCDDKEKAAPMVSNQHPAYDPFTMWDRVTRSTAPHNCTTYEANRPGGCDGCPHKGVIKNPINLGKFIPEAKPEENIVTVNHIGLGTTVVNNIPQYPFPYFRPPHGGVYIKRIASEPGDQNEGDADDELDKLIYKHDLYIEKRLKDPTHGESVVIKHILPQDGMDEFTVPLTDIMSTEKAKKVLAERGVAVSPTKILPIVNYLMKFTEMLQHTQKREVARAQFGWHDGDSCFVVGNRQINQLDITYNPKCSDTNDTYDHFTTKGSLDNWRAMADLYGKPTNAGRAFVLGLGFGAPLVKFTNIQGVTVHIMNQGSGQGKSTAQYVVNSIYGHPTSSVKGPNDKVLARQHQMGILQHLPSIVDEITNLSAEEMSDLAFSVSRGRGRDRMQASSNALRQNNTTWQTCLITSGNKSIYDMLTMRNAFPEGELLRVLEFKLEEDPTLSKTEADHWYGPVLQNNYGMACEPYIQYILNNKTEVMRIFKETQAAFDRRVGFHSKHRFYSVACAIALTGLKVAKLAGVISFTEKHVEDWLAREVRGTTEMHESQKVNTEATIGSYINEHVRNMLVIPRNSATGLPPAPITVPAGELVMRYEPDMQRLYIDQRHLKRWCGDKRISTKQFFGDLEHNGHVRVARYPLATGIFGNMPAQDIACVEIDYKLDYSTTLAVAA